MVVYQMFRPNKEKGTALLIFSIVDDDTRKEEKHFIKFSTIGKKIMLDSDTLFKDNMMILTEADLDDFQDLVGSCIDIMLERKPPQTTH